VSSVDEAVALAFQPGPAPHKKKGGA
jgi:hypothetical protein